MVHCNSLVRRGMRESRHGPSIVRYGPVGVAMYSWVKWTVTSDRVGLLISHHIGSIQWLLLPNWLKIFIITALLQVYMCKHCTCKSTGNFNYICIYVYMYVSTPDIFRIISDVHFIEVWFQKLVNMQMQCNYFCGLHQVSWLWRCPHFRGPYHSSLMY